MYFQSAVQRLHFSSLWQSCNTTCRGMWHWVAGSSQDTGLSAECPYCHGTGRILKEEAAALIPLSVSDRRLRPRRTKWIVAVSAVVTSLIGIMVVFFLAPREILVEGMVSWCTVQSFIPTDEQLWQGATANITFKQRVVFRNNNYMKVHLSKLQYKAYYRQTLAGATIVPDVTLPARSQSEVVVIVNADRIEDRFQRLVQRQCTYFPQQDKFDFRVNGTGTVLGQGQQLSHLASMFVKCGSHLTC